MLIVDNTIEIYNSDLLKFEEELILAVQHNPAMFEKLYERYYCAVFKFILKRVNHKQTTIDLTEKVFLNALANIKNYKCNRIPFLTYLNSMALSQCNNFFKSKDKTRVVVVDEKRSKNLLNQIGIINDTNSKTEKLKNTLQQLEAREIQLLELRYFEKRSFKEEGDIMNMSENKAKLKTYSILNKVKKIMKCGQESIKSPQNIEVLEKTISIPLDEIKSTIDFQPIWKKFENSKVTIVQILKEALTYVEAQVLRRAIISIGIIVILGIIGNQFVVEKSKNSMRENQSIEQTEELKIDNSKKPDIAHKEYPARFDV